MHIECTQENLAKSLQIVGRMVGTRGTLPVLGNILLSVEKGRMRLAATDLEVGVQTWIGGKVEEEGSLTVPARLLIDFVAANNDPTIRLKSEGTKLELSSQNSTAHINGIDASEFPLIPEINRVEPIKMTAKEFKDAITQTAFAAAVDETRPVLTGVLIQLQEKTIKMTATDSYRLAEKTLQLQEAHKPLKVIIPSRTMQEVSRLISDQIQELSMFISENQVLFVVGEVEFISRLIDGTFPDYEQIIPKTSATKIQSTKTNFSQVMKMASFFARESANNVQLAVEGEQVKVTAVSPQLGDSVTQLTAKVEGESIEIAFNAKFILDALNVFPTDQVELSLSGKMQAGVLRPMEKTDYLYIIMPLRVDA